MPPASVQGYPSRMVRIVEPFGAGGGPDLLALALAKQLSELWRQPVIVENITGAGATVEPRACCEVTSRRVHATHKHQRSGLQCSGDEEPPV